MKRLSAQCLKRALNAARDHRPTRFLVIGAVNTLFGYSAYLLFLFLVHDSVVALTLGNIVGVLFNFVSTGRVVFNSSDPRLLTRFFSVYACLYVVNIAALRALEAAGLGAALAQALIILPLALGSYLLQRDFVFARANTQARGA